MQEKEQCYFGSLEDNAGIFVVEEIGEDGKINIVGQSLAIRQIGEEGKYDRLTFDNIEIPKEYKAHMSKEDHKEILEVYKKAAKRLALLPYRDIYVSREMLAIPFIFLLTVLTLLILSL